MYWVTPFFAISWESLYQVMMQKNTYFVSIFRSMIKIQYPDPIQVYKALKLLKLFGPADLIKKLKSPPANE